MCVQQTLDPLQTVAVVIASLVAIWGVNAWRREYTGKRNIDLAEEVLALFYQARDAIRGIRSPFGHSGEGFTREASEDETPEEKRTRDSAYVPFERYERHQEMFGRLGALRYRFAARFGKEYRRPFDDIERVINQILLNANRKARYERVIRPPRWGPFWKRPRGKALGPSARE